MRLWSIQSLARWESLQRDGVLHATRIDGTWLCPAALSFMKEELTARTGTPPEGAVWPIWAWYRWTQKHPRPDLRSGHVAKGAKAVRIEIEVDESRVLMSDFDLWHMPLNCGGIFENEEADNAFDEELKQAGFLLPVSYSTLDSILAHPHLGPRLRKSWEKIFDLEWFDEYWTNPPEEKSLQAVFWEIRMEDVRQVHHFTGR